MLMIKCVTYGLRLNLLLFSGVCRPGLGLTLRVLRVHTS